MTVPPPGGQLVVCRCLPVGGCAVASSDRLGDGTRWRVFISHTSELRDFPEGGSYVAAVERAISAAGHVPVDMAEFPASGRPPAQVCIDKVQDCDVYLGVLGLRYGSPVRDRRKVSYTELEFDTATEAGLDRLVFLLDTGGRDLGIPPKELIDRHRVRQDRFRRRVQDSEVTTQTFDSPDKLGWLVERSLRELAAAHVRSSQKKGPPADVAPPTPAATAPAAASEGAADRAPVAVGDGAADAAPGEGGKRSSRARRNILLAAAAVAIAGGLIATLVLVPGSSGGSPRAKGSFITSSRTFTATAPWRLKIHDNGTKYGCSLAYIDTQSGKQHLLASHADDAIFQISDTGTFRWRVNSSLCEVVPLGGTRTAHLPFSIDLYGEGDTAVFAAPASVVVRVTDWHGTTVCDFRLFDPANGYELDYQEATKGPKDAVTLDPQGRNKVYLGLADCGVQVSAGR